MKRILIPLLLLFLFAQAHCTPMYATSSHEAHHVYTSSVNAQSIGYMPSHGMRSVNTMPAAARYSATVFEPFNGACPSEYSAVGTSTRTAGNGPRRDKILGPDTDPGQQYPLGEPWILLFFAALFGGIITWKKRTFHGTITGPCSENDPK